MITYYFVNNTRLIGKNRNIRNIIKEASEY